MNVLNHRQSIRLQGYNYSQPGAYFVTICTDKMQELFGSIEDGVMFPNNFGKIVEKEWLDSPGIRSEIRMDHFIVMPNHFHGIVWIVPEEGEGRGRGRGRGRACATRPYTDNGRGVDQLIDHRRGEWHSPHMRKASISSFITGFKSAVTKTIRNVVADPTLIVWHRNYYERIIRNEQELERIRQYIANNPKNWSLEHEGSL